MPAKTASLEAQVTALDASRLPVVDVWRARSGQVPSGFSVQGGSKLTLTNVTDVEVEIRRAETRIGDLGGRDLMTIPLDPAAPQLVTFTPGADGEAEGFFVLHDSRFDWRLERADAEHQMAFAGPTTLALVNHPRSGFAVQLIASGGVRARVKPGEAVTAVLDGAEARSIVLRRFGDASADASARGTICVSGGGR